MWHALEEIEHKGVAFACFLSSTKRQDAKDWCKAFGLFASGGFSVMKYGMEHASDLATEWAFRHNALYQLWLDRWASSVFVYSDADVTSIASSEAASRLEASGHAASVARLVQIQGLRPKV